MLSLCIQVFAVLVVCAADTENRDIVSMIKLVNIINVMKKIRPTLQYNILTL